MKQQGQYNNEFFQEKTLRHNEECEWKQLLEYGEQRAREKGIGPEDVAFLVKEYRSETCPSSSGNG